jgi:hypothetical protein
LKVRQFQGEFQYLWGLKMRIIRSLGLDFIEKEWNTGKKFISGICQRLRLHKF